MHRPLHGARSPNERDTIPKRADPFITPHRVEDEHGGYGDTIGLARPDRPWTSYEPNLSSPFLKPAVQKPAPAPSALLRDQARVRASPSVHSGFSSGPGSLEPHLRSDVEERSSQHFYVAEEAGSGKMRAHLVGSVWAGGGGGGGCSGGGGDGGSGGGGGDGGSAGGGGGGGDSVKGGSTGRGSNDTVAIAKSAFSGAKPRGTLGALVDMVDSGTIDDLLGDSVEAERQRTHSLHVVGTSRSHAPETCEYSHSRQSEHTPVPDAAWPASEHFRYFARLMSPTATKHADCIIRPTDSVANTQPSARARDIERAPAKLQPTCRYVRARARARACACTPLGCACRPSFLQLVSADGAMAGAAALARTRRCATHEHALVLARVVAPADASARRAGVRCDVCGRSLDVLRTVHCCVECDWVVRQRLPTVQRMVAYYSTAECSKRNPTRAASG